MLLLRWVVVEKSWKYTVNKEHRPQPGLSQSCGESRNIYVEAVIGEEAMQCNS